MTDQELIDRVINDPDCPKRLSKEGLYVSYGRVYQDFTNSDGKPMRRRFHFSKYNMDGKYKDISVRPQIRGDFEVLVYGAEFLNIQDAIDSYFANVSDKQLDRDLELSEFKKYSEIGPEIFSEAADKVFEERRELMERLAESDSIQVDSSWVKEEGHKIVDFIKNAPETELDQLLKDSNFGALLNEAPEDPRKE